MAASRYLPAAQSVAQAFPGLLKEIGLVPWINRYVLTETPAGNVWLFVVMNDSISGIVSSYGAPEVLIHLSTQLHGHRILFSNSYGLRYAVLLT